MIFICCFISKSSRHFISHLGIVPKIPITSGITVIFMFHIFLVLTQSPDVYVFLYFYSLSSNFYLWSSGTGHYLAGILFTFFKNISWSVIRQRLGDPFVAQNPRKFCTSFFLTDSGLCRYNVFVWSDFVFFCNSQGITFISQSCLVLHSFCANLLHSLIMWLIVSSLSPHKVHFLFCSIIFDFILTSLVFMRFVLCCK